MKTILSCIAVLAGAMGIVADAAAGNSPAISEDQTTSLIPAALPVSRPVVDVWQLRREVAQVESLETTDDTDVCYEEGDTWVQEDHACVENIRVKYAEYQRALEEFNKTWLPVMMDAIQKGDLVAEVIMRKCDTTHVFDRSEIESTCDKDPQRRVIAAKRLYEIGFWPAIDPEGEPGYCEFPSCGSRSPRGQVTLQKIILNALRHGNFGSVDYEATYYWRVRDDPWLDWQLKYNASLIVAARQDVTRAFRFLARDPASQSRDHAKLKLNRKPSRSKSLAWGPETINGNYGTRYKENHWRSYSNASLCENGEEYPRVEGDLRNLLRATEDNIAQYLKQDSRWAVFLMQRVGHHEWVPWEPDGAAVSADEIDPSWLGHWVWESSQTVYEFGTPGDLSESEGSADISRLGDATRITIRTRPPESPPHQDVVNCELRYSGGLTHYSTKGSNADTPLGDIDDFGKDANRRNAGCCLNADGKINGLEPLEHNKRYRQVLMQCSGAEMQNNDMVRFLLLAGDTLIEVASMAPACEPLYIRHFKRAKDARPK